MQYYLNISCPSPPPLPLSLCLIGNVYMNSYHIFILQQNINHLFAGQKQLLGMWITKNGKNYYTIYVTKYRRGVG